MPGRPARIRGIPQIIASHHRLEPPRGFGEQPPVPRIVHQRAVGLVLDEPCRHRGQDGVDSQRRRAFLLRQIRTHEFCRAASCCRADRVSQQIHRDRDTRRPHRGQTQYVEGSGTAKRLNRHSQGGYHARPVPGRKTAHVACAVLELIDRRVPQIVEYLLWGPRLQSRSQHSQGQCVVAHCLCDRAKDRTVVFDLGGRTSRQ